MDSQFGDGGSQITVTLTMTMFGFPGTLSGP